MDKDNNLICKIHNNQSVFIENIQLMEEKLKEELKDILNNYEILDKIENIKVTILTFDIDIYISFKEDITLNPFELNDLTFNNSLNMDIIHKNNSLSINLYSSI